MDGETRSPYRSIATVLTLILAVGFALRLLPVVCHGAHPVLFMDSDSWEYHRIANNLLAGNGYSWDTQPPYTPNLYRTPGLPVLLAGVYALTGHSIPAAIAVQAVVSTLAVCLTFVLTRTLTGRPWLAVLAAGVLALDPVAIQYSNILLTETFSATLLLLASLFTWKYLTSGDSKWLGANGGLLAVGILVHPVLLFLPLFLPILPLLTRATRTSRQVAFALAATALALAPASAWIARNWVVGDHLGISSVTAVNMLKYKAAGVEADIRGTSREVERERLTAECEADLPPDATPGQRFRLWQSRGVAVLLAHPWVYANVHLRGTLLQLIGPERDHTTRLLYGPAVLDAEGNYTDASTAAARTLHPVLGLEVARYAILGWQGLLLICLAIGAWQVACTRPLLFAALCVIPIYVLLLSGGPEASPRFRVMYLPTYALLTAAGVSALARRTRPSVASPAPAGPVAPSRTREPRAARLGAPEPAEEAFCSVGSAGD